MKSVLKRWWFWLLLFFALELSGLTIFRDYGKPTISDASMRRIKARMTPAEVESIIGAPPGRYGGSDQLFKQHRPEIFTSEGMALQDEKHRGWINDVGYIIVRFDCNDRARYVHLEYHNGRPPVSIWEKAQAVAQEWFHKIVPPSRFKSTPPGPYFP